MPSFLLFILLHVGVSVFGNVALLEARGKAVVIDQGAVAQALSLTDHRNVTALDKLIITSPTHHSLSLAGIRQLLHRNGDKCLVK